MGIATYEDVDEMEALLRARMRTRPRDEWMRLFVENYDVGADPFLTPSEFLDQAQVKANDLVVEVGDPEVGLTRQPAPLARVDGRGIAPGAAPRLNEDPGFDEDAWGGQRSAAATITTGAPAHAGPLAGVVILEVAYFLAGPLGATLLAELGARVIKVEPLEGDPFRRTGREFAHLAHGKESIAIDLKSDVGREILLKLVRRADALVHSFRPGVAERIGIDYQGLHHINPRLVYVYAGSYGSRGPWAHRPSFHSTPNALVGAGIAQAGIGNPPVDDSWPDPVAGNAVGTALALGLWHSRRTSQGVHLETNMLLSATYAYSNAVVDFAGRPAVAVSDGEQHGLNAGYRLYRASSGWLFVAAPTDASWARFAWAIGRPDIASNYQESRERGPSGVSDIVEREIASRPAADWERILRAASVAAVQADGPSLPEFLLGNGLLTATEHPNFGRYWKLPPKSNFSRTPSRVGDAAALGQHTRSILLELGYREGDIDEMLRRGVARDPMQGDLTPA
jgi:crotonobetainyl-CoA:carnitine CoA-transferase CaiB-like acyl-CoA transferase